MEPIYISQDEHPNEEEAKEAIYPSLYKNHFESILIPYAKIQSRTKEITKLISHQYDLKHEPIVLVCILKGSSPFYNLLLNELSLLSIPYMIEFVRVKSYVGNESSGDVKLYSLEMPKSITNHHVLIVEDIVDTGTTLNAIMPKFQECQPKSLEVCTLLEKRLTSESETEAEAENKCIPKYVGFSIPDEFVVGFGLDYNEMYRDLRDIWILGQKGIDLGGYGDC